MIPIPPDLAYAAGVVVVLCVLVMLVLLIVTPFTDHSQD